MGYKMRHRVNETQDKTMNEMPDKMANKMRNEIQGEMQNKVRNEIKEAPGRILWIFAVGQLGWSLLSGVVTNWLVYFYQPSQELVSRGQTLYIPQGAVFLGLTVIGLITASGRIVDAVTDPWIAGMSDRCAHRLGRRIPFLRRSALPFGLATVLIFVSPEAKTSPVNGVFLLAMDVLFYIFMTMYCTPFNALIPELGRSQKNRINLSTYISMTFIVGTAFGYLVPNVAGMFESRFGYAGSIRIAAAIFAVIGVICLLVPAFLIDETLYADTTPCESSAFRSLVKTFQNREFRKFVASDVVYFIALTMFQTGLPFYITVLMKLEEGTTFLLFALMTAFSLVFYPFINRLAGKLGKKKLVGSAFLFYSFVFLITTFCGMFGIGGMVWGVLIAVCASLPMAVLGILPQAIVADIAEADGILTGENRQGMFYAARTFAFKLGQSAAMLLFTSISVIGAGGLGYRLTAAVAAALCLVGALIFFTYDERKIFKIIRK